MTRSQFLFVARLLSYVGLLSLATVSTLQAAGGQAAPTLSESAAAERSVLNGARQSEFRERRYQVARPVWETTQRETRRKVLRPVWETQWKEEPCFVRKVPQRVCRMVEQEIVERTSVTVCRTIYEEEVERVPVAAAGHRLASSPPAFGGETQRMQLPLPSPMPPTSRPQLDLSGPLPPVLPEGF